MEILNWQVRPLILDDGSSPFDKWFNGLRDCKAKILIESRLIRARTGNFGNCRNLNDGVYELKIHYGPGFRIYFGRVGKTIVLINGGDKNSQRRDIVKAKRLWWRFINETR